MSILFYHDVLQKKRSRRRSKTKYSVASTDAIVESTTSEVVHSKASSDIVGTSEVLSQIKKQSVCEYESIHSAGHVAIPDAAPDVAPDASPDGNPDAAPNATPSTNRTYINHVINEKLIDIDNNNEKPIEDRGDQEG